MRRAARETGTPHRGATLLRDFLKVCEAMAFAHSRGVIHRDLKPDNIMLGSHGEVLVMDWGLAKPLGAEGVEVDMRRFGVDEQADPLQTQDGDVMGTPAYMSPEQASGRIDQIDQKSDVFALGAVLYTILTLELPYTARDSVSILDQILEGRLIPPRERVPEAVIPAELEAAVLKAMAREPDERYPRVQEFQGDLEAYLDGRRLQAASYNPVQILAIQDALADFVRNRTCIIIAHRFSTLSFCDRILVVNEGRIESEGTHETLMNDSSTYRDLFERQLNLGVR